MAAPEVIRVPMAIDCDETVISLSSHPSENIFAAGKLDGEINIFSFSNDENKVLLNLSHHKKSCRVISFTKSGDHFFSASKDKSIQLVDVTTGKVKQKFLNAHTCPIYSLLVIDENILATGDDDGFIKLWDSRKEKAIMEMRENEDFISALAIDDKQKTLLATCGDGTLSVFNIRRHRFDLQSETMDSEMLALAVCKRGRKVVCGMGDGALNLFNWSEWGNLSDRFPGHPTSIDCMVKVTDDIVCTGSLDGTIRAVHILPNRFLGIVGEHEDFPIESLAVSHDQSILISSSHDQKIKFWNIQELDHIDVDPQEKCKKKKRKNKRLNTSGKEEVDFFADLE